MEPLDMDLAKRLAKTFPNHSLYFYSNKDNTNKIRICTEDRSIEDRLRNYVASIRSNEFPTQNRYKDNADYKLTKYILRVIEDACMISLDGMRDSFRRNNKLAIARAIFTYAERRLNGRSYPAIGAIINKHHTSIMHMEWRIGKYEDDSVFQNYMKNDKLRHLYECSKAGVWAWVKEDG